MTSPSPLVSSGPDRPLLFAVAADGMRYGCDAPSATTAAAATVAEVIADAVDTITDQITQWMPSSEPVRYVIAPSTAVCAAAHECLPLAALLGLDPTTTGHLHRQRDDGGAHDSRLPFPRAGSPGSTDPGSFAADDDAAKRYPDERQTLVPLQAVGRMIAAEVHRDLLGVELAHARRQVENLEKALHTNRGIGVAFGVLMATERCTSEQAFELLRAASQNQNRKLREVAADVQYSGAIPSAIPARRHA